MSFGAFGAFQLGRSQFGNYFGEQLELLAEIELDSGTEYVSLYGVSTDRWYSERLDSTGDIMREISTRPGQFRGASFSFSLKDPDNRYRNLRNTTPWKNRPVTVKLGFRDLESSTFTPFATGKIQQWSARGDLFEIECEDTTLRAFDQPVSTTIRTSRFPELPDSTQRNLVPLVIGACTGPEGALPAYLIDAATGASGKYIYVAAKGTIEIENVYVYRSLVTGSPLPYTVQQETFDGETYTTIRFDSDQRDSGRPNEIEISYDSGESFNGNARTNPADIYKDLLLEEGFSESEIDDVSFEAAKDRFTTLQVSGAFAITDKSESLRGVAEKFAQSFNLTTYVTGAGKIGITVPQPLLIEETDMVELDESDIVSFDLEGADDLVTAIQYEFQRNFHTNEFLESNTYKDEANETNVGETILETLELWYVRDATSAQVVASDNLFFAHEDRTTIRASINPKLLKRIKIGDDIKVTHFRGLGESGFSDAVFRVLGVGLGFDGINFVGRLRLVDITEIFGQLWLLGISTLGEDTHLG